MQTNNHRHCLSQLRLPSCCRCWCMHLAVIYDSCLFQRNFIYLWCVRVYVWFLTWHATEEKRTAKLNTNSSFSANSFFVRSLSYLRDCGKPWQAVVKKNLVIKLCFFYFFCCFVSFLCVPWWYLTKSTFYADSCISQASITEKDKFMRQMKRLFITTTTQQKTTTTKPTTSMNKCRVSRSARDKLNHVQRLDYNNI